MYLFSPQESSALWAYADSISSSTMHTLALNTTNSHFSLTQEYMHNFSNYIWIRPSPRTVVSLLGDVLQLAYTVAILLLYTRLLHTLLLSYCYIHCCYTYAVATCTVVTWLSRGCHTVVTYTVFMRNTRAHQLSDFSQVRTKKFLNDLSCQ